MNLSAWKTEGIHSMFRIAIVEDDKTAAKALHQYVLQYGKQNNVSFHVSLYENGMQFLKERSVAFDVVFMDIEMPTLNGMETAELMRKNDDITCLVFVTNMAQYAIKGYEVDALDYLLKPVPYSVFAFKLGKALQLAEQRKQKELVIKTKDGLIRLPVSDIYYLESMQHKVLYHTADEIIECWSTLAQEEKKLDGFGFARCHTSFLVNLRYITRVDGEHVYLGSIHLPLSRGKRSDFLNTLTSYLGG